MKFRIPEQQCEGWQDQHALVLRGRAWTLTLMPTVASALGITPVPPHVRVTYDESSFYPWRVFEDDNNTACFKDSGHAEAFAGLRRRQLTEGAA